YCDKAAGRRQPSGRWVLTIECSVRFRGRRTPFMLLLSCSNVSRGYGATPLFEGVAFELHAGDRVGFVGPNGAGKTTLLKVLAGEEYADTGEGKLHAGARLGVLRQVAEFPPGRTLFAEAKSAFDELLAAQHELIEVADRLAQPYDEADHKALAARFDRL